MTQDVQQQTTQLTENDDMKPIEPVGVRRAPIPVLTVVYHPMLRRIGDRAFLGELVIGQSVQISRQAPHFSPPHHPHGGAPLGHSRISRTPFELRPLGNSGIDKIMLPVGRHEIDLVNDQAGFRETRTVQVSPGRTVAIDVTLPKSTVSLNAIPWASVSVDGQNIGDTPIGNFPLTVGPHEVVFRNAELGDERRTIMVTARAPVRLSVDLTKK
jgi:hypothetical protein